MTRQPHPDAVLIDKIGGPSATAAMCGITSQAVSHWKVHGIPRSWRLYLALSRPDVFGETPDVAAAVSASGA
jgi:hypothetical protein